MNLEPGRILAEEYHADPPGQPAWELGDVVVITGRRIGIRHDDADGRGEWTIRTADGGFIDWASDAFINSRQEKTLVARHGKAV